MRFIIATMAFIQIVAGAAYGQSLLHIARDGNVPAARRYLQRGGDVNEANQNNVTALFVAAENGHADMIRFLAARGADVNARAFPADMQLTPLISAAMKGHSAAITALLDSGAGIEMAAFQGMTALHAAAYHGKIEAVRVLVNRGANRNALFRGRMTAAVIAESKGYTNIKLYLEKSIPQQQHLDESL